MKNFTASDLKDRIELKRESATDDCYGGEVIGEIPVSICWANVYAPKARDGVIAMADSVIVSYEVTVRAGLAVEYDDIIVWHGTRMRVKDFRLIQDRRFLSISCTTER